MSVELDHLRRVLALAAVARKRGDHPFAAALVVDGRIAAEATNRVVTGGDLTAHAETMLVRQLEERGDLAGMAQGVVYASCEPCPMCVGALFWAGCRHVVFGLSHGRLNELAAAPGQPMVGFSISAADIGGRAQPPMLFDGPHLQDEAAEAHVGFWWG